tara:strand:- start:105 stop:659 length:555 start_codon:yes stop_codon:yes gene_type:complete
MRVWDHYVLGTKVSSGKEALIKWFSRQPWNAKLKSKLLFGLGEVMVKFQKRPKCFYGNLLQQKKATLTAQNDLFQFREEANQKMEDKAASPTTETWKHWEAGRLSPGHIHNRARRWMCSLLISHLHEVMYTDYHGVKPDAPYIFDHPIGGEGTPNEHRHYMPPPLWNLEQQASYGGLNLKEMKD